MLISLLIIVIVVGLLLYLVRMLPIDAQFKNIALVLVIVIAIIWLLNVAGMIPHGLM